MANRGRDSWCRTCNVRRTVLSVLGNEIGKEGMEERGFGTTVYTTPSSSARQTKIPSLSYKWRDLSILTIAVTSLQNGSFGLCRYQLGQCTYRFIRPRLRSYQKRTRQVILGEMKMNPLSSYSSITSFVSLHTLLSSSSKETTNIVGKASSIGMRSSRRVYTLDNGSAACCLITSRWMTLNSISPFQ